MPKKIDIELVGLCNQGCVYCNWQDRAVKNVMPLERAHALQDEILALSPERNVGLHGVGEPTLHPDFEAIVRRGLRLGLHQGFSTNCTMLEWDFSDVEDLEVNLAIPWAGTKWRDSVDNAKRYLDKSPKHEVFVQMVCHESVADKYDIFLEEFLPYKDVATLFAKQPLTWPRMEPMKGFIPDQIEGVVVDDIETPKSIGDGCVMPEEYILCLADGSFAPCCVGHAYNWRLPKGSIAKAWNSLEMEIIRGQHKRRNGALCKDCHL